MLRRKINIVYTFVKLCCRAFTYGNIRKRKEKKKETYRKGGSIRYRVGDNFEATCSVPNGQILSNKYELTQLKSRDLLHSIYLAAPLFTGSEDCFILFFLNIVAQNENKKNSDRYVVWR